MAVVSACPPLAPADISGPSVDQALVLHEWAELWLRHHGLAR